MKEETGVTKQVEEKVKRWIEAVNHEKQCRSYLNSAETEILNSIEELGRLLSPKDAKPGEVFNIWYSNGLLRVEILAGHKYDISWRQEPSNMF